MLTNRSDQEIINDLTAKLAKSKSKSKHAGKMIAIKIAREKRIRNLVVQYRTEVDNELQTLETRLQERERALNEMKGDSLTDMFFAHVRAGHIEKIQAALLLNPQLTNAIDRSESALHIACYNDQFDAVKLLLERNPELFLAINNRRRTPIEEMAARDSVAMLKLLSEQRVKLLAKHQDDKNKDVFIHNLLILSDTYLYNHGQTAANVRVLLRNKMFFAAISQNDMTKLQSIIRYIPDIDVKNKNGETALHMAVGLGNIEMVKYLLEKGADPLIQWHGETTLYYANRLPYNRKEIVEVIQTHLFLKNATAGNWSAMQENIENGANIKDNLNCALQNAMKAYGTAAIKQPADALDQAAARYEAEQPEPQVINAPHPHKNIYKTVIRNVLTQMGQFGIRPDFKNLPQDVLAKRVIRHKDNEEMTLNEYVRYTEGKKFR